MSYFITVDVNGWLDRLVDEDGEARLLGFRSCLYWNEGTWLLGAQALAAARDARTDELLVDAMDALVSAAGYRLCEPIEYEALPAALWQLAAEATRRSGRPVGLALVIPDGRYLGEVVVREDTGRTSLETLYDTLERARPRSLARNRIELVWRSVAALKAVLDKGGLGDKAGAILVVSINRRTFWTVLELRPWPGSSQTEGPLRIVRKARMEECEDSEAWTAQRAEDVRTVLANQGDGDLAELHRWTRWIEILATDMRPESLAELGIDSGAIEHRSWPTPDETWSVWPDTPLINKWTKASLPSSLMNRIEMFRNGEEGPPLAIVVESPVGVEMTSGFENLIRTVAAGIPIFRAVGADTARASARLAESLGRDQEEPAWLDEVPGIELEIQNRTDNNVNSIQTEWMAVIPENEVIPAGETYHSRPDKARRITLAPGIEHIHLHLRRGHGGAWNERYSGRSTGHTIRPTDHERFVEPLARVRPLSGEARIEIVEHPPDGRSEALPGSRASITWSDMSEEPPIALRSIPDLYIFRSDKKVWKDLECLLRRVVEDSKTKAGISISLKDDLYKCTQRQWQQRTFPLGSDGEPPRVSDPLLYQASRKLVNESTAALLHDLERTVQNGEKVTVKEANRLHMPLTWLFTGCPEPTVEILLKAIMHPKGREGHALYMENDFSAWSIYSGVGRAVRSEQNLRTIFDVLIGQWIDGGNQRQDKFLLAAVTHPMARRVAVRKVLNESRQRFERVKHFLDQHLANILNGIHDPRPQSKGKKGFHPNLELRYVTMGYRGLCQVRYSNPDWFDVSGKDARETFTKLQRASRIGKDFERDLVDRTAPYLIGEGEDPTMPSGF